MPLKITRRPAFDPTVRSSCASLRPRTKAAKADSPARWSRVPQPVPASVRAPFDSARCAAAITCAGRGSPRA